MGQARWALELGGGGKLLRAVHLHMLLCPKEEAQSCSSRPPGCSCCGMSFGVSLELCLLQEKVFSPVSWATETSDLSPTHRALCKSHRFLGSGGSLPPCAASLSLGPPDSLLPHHPLFLSSLPPGVSKMISETRQAYQRDLQNSQQIPIMVA